MLLHPVNQFVIAVTINLLVKNNMLFYFVILNTVVVVFLWLGRMLIPMWTFIKGSQKYRQDIFLRLSNRLAIFEVLEICCQELWHAYICVQSNKIRKWTHFKLRQRSKTNFWWLLNMVEHTLCKKHKTRDLATKLGSLSGATGRVGECIPTCMYRTS